MSTQSVRRPFARLTPVDHARVTLTDRFWAPRQEVNRTSTLPSQYRHCEETGRVDNFRRVSGRKDCKFEGIYFNDSDIYKLLEAVAHALATHPEDKALNDIGSTLIDEIGAAQDEDGYLNTYFSLERKGDRWTNLKDMHELYCAGHLIEACVAHYRATGSTALLDIGRRFADHVCATFGPASTGRREGACGHEEVELALVALYRATGEKRYLDEADYFVRARGQEPTALYRPAGAWTMEPRYFQDHVPFTNLDEVTGHAVRMVYLACGAADVYAETGDPAFLNALQKQWSNMTERRMYVTGGLGARWEGEAFGKDWELPSDRAYAETCAAIGGIFWNHRMLHLDVSPLPSEERANPGEGPGVRAPGAMPIALDGHADAVRSSTRRETTVGAKYADLLELQLYNAMLAGLSLDGAQYFYQNPLSDDGAHRRQPWFGCACCPPNIARLLASLGGYFYSTDEGPYLPSPERGTSDSGRGAGGEGSIYVHLYASGEAVIDVDGAPVRLRQETNYPWDGDIALTVIDTAPALRSLRVRIPGWAEGATVQVGNEAAQPVDSGAYARIDRAFAAGDTVRIHLPMPVRRLAADPRVADTSGKIALARGPLVYCLESVDHAGVDVRQITLSRTAPIKAAQSDILGGIVTLETAGQVLHWPDRLYASGDAPAQPGQTIDIRAVPYYAWANREPGPMTVWIHATE